MTRSSPITLHASPSAGFDEPFEMLLACHERVERMLTLLERLQAHAAEHGADAAARSAAQDVMRYFDIAGPAHHEDEERHLFPRLLAHPEAAVAALAQALQRDHVRMAAGWAEVRRDLQQVADGHWPPDGGAEKAAARWADFASLYRRHIVDEEGSAYPSARLAIDDRAQAHMGEEMARRRGLR